MRLKQVFAWAILLIVGACTVSIVTIKKNEDKVNVGELTETRIDSINTDLKQEVDATKRPK